MKTKVTAKELYDEVFKGYDSSKDKSRIRKIFDQKSEFNRRLAEFGRRVKEHVPNLEEELEKLGFDCHLIVQLDDFVIPNYIDYYFNGKGDVIKVVKYGKMMIVELNDLKKTFENKYLGENEKEFLRWLKYRI